jgi:hypothetical protein
VTEQHPDWLESLVGQRILIGLTWVSQAGEVEGRSQFHGTVRAASLQGVIVLRADGRPDLTLPPDPDLIKPAAPGHYRLRGSGEVVENPDLLCTMRMVPDPRPSGGSDVE